MANFPPNQSPFQVDDALADRLASTKEAIWFRIGVMQSAMNDRERAFEAFERVLAVNPGNVKAVTQAGAVLAKKECYSHAVSYLQRAITAEPSCGEAWAVLAHCYVMTDDLRQAYSAYQNALCHLPNPRDPNLWYGIGLLYDRYGSLDNALEAFLAVLSISPDFERADEVCFCIGIIYKEQQNFDEALKYFNKVVNAANPPPPLTRADGWYQIGHVNELKKDIPVAFQMYKQALGENPNHPKTLQNVGWLEHQHNHNSPEGIRLLKLSSELDASDGQTWYLLGRVFMALREFRQAYDAYQQAVYRDGRNATFWCSIGVLYYQMNQYRDAMDAYSRAIRLNPYVSEVWYDLGTLYESCGQNNDAIDAYRRAAELSPDNSQIIDRLGVLENTLKPNQTAATATTAPHPHPQQQPQQQPQPHSNQPQPQPPHSLPPQQMPPDMHHPSQPPTAAGHSSQPTLNPVLNRSVVASALQHVPQPLAPPQKLVPQSNLPPSSQLASPHTQQMTHPSSVTQTGNHQGSASLPHHTAHMELSAIPSINPHPMSHSQPIGHSVGFSHQDGRLPAPPTGVQLTPPQGSNHLSPMMSQPLHNQQNTTVLPSPGMGVSQQGSLNNFRRSTPLPSSHSLQPLNNHHQVSQEHQQSIRHTTHLPQVVAPQQGQQQQQHTHLPHMSVPNQQQQMPQSQQTGQNPSDQQQHHQRSQPQGHGPSSHIASHEVQSTQALPSHHTSHQTQQQQSPHSQGQGQQLQRHSASESLPHIQTLPQLQALPHMQTYDPDQQKRQDPQQQHPGLSAPLDHRRHGQGQEQGNDRSQYMSSLQGDMMRRQKFERPGERNDMGLPKPPKAEGEEIRAPFPSRGPDGVRASQSMYGGMQNSVHHPIPSSGNRIPALREPEPDSNQQQLPPRSMSMHEITQSDPRGPPRRLEEINREEREQVERARHESQHGHASHQNMDKPSLSERLPAMSSLSGPPQLNDVSRESRDDARLLSSVAATGLPLPPRRGIPPLNSNDMQKSSSSPLPPPGSVGISSAIPSNTQALPPMSTSRNPLGSMSHEGKESQGNTVGASSLTKFGNRTPVTPANNSVTPASLPSPLPTRKNSGSGGVLHAARSPRIPNTSNALTFKPIPIPPSTSSGQIESVPSPSSLPVLPALSSHPNNNDDKSSPREISGDHESNRHESNRDVSEFTSDSRMNLQKAEENGVKEGSNAMRNEDGMMNKSILGILRSAPAPVQSLDRERQEKEGSMRPAISSGMRHDVDNNGGGMKREGCSKDEPGRTAKRPRLHDLNDGPGVMSFGGYNDEEKHKNMGNKEVDHKDDEGHKGSIINSSKAEIPSYKDIKADLRATNNVQDIDGESAQKREGMVRTNESDSGKSLPMGAQVIDLPRLSTPISKLGGPSLAGNTPLPSFRSERKNLTASRGGSGSGSGKSNSQDNTSRSSLPFALRSAPVSSLPGPLKSHGLSPNRGIVDVGDVNNSQGVEDSGGKRVSEDKRDTSPLCGGNSRDNVISDRVTNGDVQKVSSGGVKHDSRATSDVNGKDEKQSGRTEIHTTAT